MNGVCIIATEVVLHARAGSYCSSDAFHEINGVVTYAMIIAHECIQRGSIGSYHHDGTVLFLCKR